LKLQLQLLSAGTLLCAPNQVYARVEDLDARINELNERIASATAASSDGSRAQRVTPGDTAAVTALLDRLLHHAHVLKCGPRSWRTRVQTDLRHEEGVK
jgi:hypothetical protein